MKNALDVQKRAKEVQRRFEAKNVRQAKSMCNKSRRDIVARLRQLVAGVGEGGEAGQESSQVGEARGRQREGEPTHPPKEQSRD
eukprot:CAMPEP_0206464472 /NCGR_PEP_ID=MMETSP0324_2-20121206/27238_1 /ASSEMBLY_ACC=CAM_ASM_000836 /TAXON_ID=2866 /ORGANISM="Crypthecodinium cohnii, Strain Seligo" /LENGTH=83 /DNA_ID=CAMNT_0053937113 /DNA_START=116 /DNA_END=367 /DNA_ORIENTATION=+